MSWIRDGEHVAGKYMDQLIQGVVIESRVKYGGKVQLTVLLDKPIQLRWRPVGEPRNVVLVDTDEVVTVPG
jgi:hypothetical protein